MWYAWTAALNGLATFDSCTADFDSHLAAYKGDTLTGLTPVYSKGGSNSCGAGNDESKITFFAAAGTTYRIAVDGPGDPGDFTIAWTRAPPPPTNTAPPIVAGGTSDGNTLTVTTGQWSAEGTVAYGYQWQRCNSTLKNVAIGQRAYASQSLGADNGPDKAFDGSPSTYWNSGDYEPQWLAIDLQAPYPVSTIRAAIAQLPDGNTVHDVFVAGPNPGDDFLPLAHLVGFTTDRDAPLEAAGPTSQVEYVRVATSVSPSWVAWQEVETLSRCSEIPGATGSTYALTGADVASTIRAVVRASNTAGTTAAASGETNVVAGIAPTNAAAPSISGHPVVSETLAAKPGSWAGSLPLSYAYAWQRCKGATCRDIVASNDVAYDVGAADEGFGIRIVVTASNLAGSAVAVSASTRAVPYICEVPVVRGKTVPTARRLLGAEHCALGRVKRAYSKRVSRGRILSQSPLPFHSLRGGAKVSVVVSRGRRPRRGRR